MAALPYKAAEAEGAGRVGGEESQHPAAEAGYGARGAAGLEASAAGKAIASLGPLLALDVRPSEAADPTQGTTTGHRF